MLGTEVWGETRQKWEAESHGLLGKYYQPGGVLNAAGLVLVVWLEQARAPGRG